MMMIHPLLVAIVQGLTEAFPISSSAHIAWLFYPNSVPKGLDAVVHMGSFFALCLCFRSTLYDLFIGAWHTMARKTSVQKSAFLTVLITTVPCGMAGLVCALCHIRFDTIAVTACSMIVCGGVLYYADRRPTVQPSIQSGAYSPSSCHHLGQHTNFGSDSRCQSPGHWHHHRPPVGIFAALVGTNQFYHRPALDGQCQPCAYTPLNACTSVVDDGRPIGHSHHGPECPTCESFFMVDTVFFHDPICPVPHWCGVHAVVKNHDVIS